MFNKLINKIKNKVLQLRYYLIIKLIGNMPVIVNCTIYDDIFEYNFGKIRFTEPHIACNNTIKRFATYANRYKSNTYTFSLNDVKPTDLRILKEI